MITNDHKKVIRSRFKTLVATPNNLPTQYDNQDSGEIDTENKLWCRLTILPARSSLASVGGSGGNKYRNPGVMIAQLFVPAGTGSKASDVLAKAIQDEFRGKTDSRIHFKEVSTNVVGNKEKNKEWQLNVKCPFWVDD